MIIGFLSILSTLFLVEIEMGVIAFIATLIIIIIAVVVKVIKNKRLTKNKSEK